MRRARARDLPEPTPQSEPPRQPESHPRGQSLVEFALVLPMLLILLLGIADFGRVFQAGIILEAAARNAAEAAAQEYVQLSRNKPSLTSDDYQRLHEVALETVCSEGDVLPNWLDPDSDGICSMPYAAVCIHDAAALDQCGSEAASAPSGCSLLGDAWNAGVEQQDYAPLPYVEVRACYRFTTLFNMTDLQLPFGWGLSLGEVWLQRDRSFVAGEY